MPITKHLNSAWMSQLANNEALFKVQSKSFGLTYDFGIFCLAYFQHVARDSIFMFGYSVN